MIKYICNKENKILRDGKTFETAYFWSKISSSGVYTNQQMLFQNSWEEQKYIKVQISNDIHYRFNVKKMNHQEANWYPLLINIYDQQKNLLHTYSPQYDYDIDGYPTQFTMYYMFDKYFSNKKPNQQVDYQYIQVTGCSFDEINGLYQLTDISSVGRNRIWNKGNYSIYYSDDNEAWVIYRAYQGVCCLLKDTEQPINTDIISWENYYGGEINTIYYKYDFSVQNVQKKNIYLFFGNNISRLQIIGNTFYNVEKQLITIKKDCLQSNIFLNKQSDLYSWFDKVLLKQNLICFFDFDNIQYSKEITNTSPNLCYFKSVNKNLETGNNYYLNSRQFYNNQNYVYLGVSSKIINQKKCLFFENNQGGANILLNHSFGKNFKQFSFSFFINTYSAITCNNLVSFGCYCNDINYDSENKDLGIGFALKNNAVGIRYNNNFNYFEDISTRINYYYQQYDRNEYVDIKLKKGIYLQSKIQYYITVTVAQQQLEVGKYCSRIKLYINGQLVKEFVIEQRFKPATKLYLKTANDRYYISGVSNGNINDSTYAVNSYIRELGVYDKQLNINEIKYLYNNGRGIFL